MKQSHSIIASVGSGLLVLLLIWLVKSEASSSGLPKNTGRAEGIFSLDAAQHDFGTISMAQGNVSKRFKAKNISGKDVIIGKIYSSCMCTQARLYAKGKSFGPFGMPGHGPIPAINEKILPYEETEIEVIFNPRAHGPAGVGRIGRSVFLETDAGKVELKINAYVTP